MVKRIIFAPILALTFILAFSCSNDEDDHSIDPEHAIPEIETNVVQGDWIISSYVDSGTDETSDYDDFTFTFTPDGVVSASSSTEMLTGAWNVEHDDSSNDDSPDNDVDFTLFFGVADSHAFDDLNDDWYVVSYTSTMISLRDVSGGSGEIDTLIFTRK